MSDFLPIKLEGEMRDILRDAVGNLIEGAAADVQRYLLLIAHDLTLAVAYGKAELVDELKAQAVLLAEQNRVRIAKQHEANFNRVLDLVFRVGAATLAAAI